MSPEEREEQANHAARQKARTESRRQTPDQKEQRGMEAMVTKIVRAEVQAAFAKLTIKNGQNITFSGSGFNITASVSLPQPMLQALALLAQGTWTGVDFCGGVTAEALLRNVVIPP